MADNRILGSIAGVLGVGSLTAGTAFGWMLTFGPHGQFQALPKCGAASTCIVVAGLEHDVYWMPFTGGGSIADFEDGDTQRMVRWVRPAAKAMRDDIEVLRYPREVKLPDPGDPDEARERAATQKAIRHIFASSGADLMLVGAVEEGGERYQLAFVAPDKELPTDPPTYSAQQSDAPATFVQALRAALRDLNPPATSQPAALKPPVRVAPPTPPAAPPAPPPQVTPPAPQQPTANAPQPAPSPPVRPRPAPPPVIRTPPPPESPVVIPADISVRPYQAQIERLYRRHITDRTEPGQVTLDCAVTISGDLTGCYVVRAPRGADRFTDALTDFANGEMRGTPASTNGLATANGRARFSVRTAQGD